MQGKIYLIKSWFPNDFKNRKLKPPIPEKKSRINAQIPLNVFDSNTNTQSTEKDHISGWSFVAQEEKSSNQASH